MSLYVKYKIPNEVTTELKINKVLYLFDLLFLISIIVFRQITLPFIHSRFSIYYTIFLALFAVFMLIRPASNPKKRMYQTLIYIIVRKKDDYSAIDYSIIDDEESEES